MNLKWDELGLEKEKAMLIAPKVKDFQPAIQFKIDDEIVVKARQGWLIIVKNEMSF